MGPFDEDTWLIIGGAAVLFLLLSESTSSDLDNALSATPESNDMGDGRTIEVRCTGYHPFEPGMTEAQRIMEGRQNDSHSNPLHTLQAFQRGEAEYVSVSGDDAAWPYGQRISLSGWPGVVFRVVDTGGHFRGAPVLSGFASKTKGKFYRVLGREPLDICIEGTALGADPNQTCTIHEGDAFGSSKTPDAVQYAQFYGQEG